MGRKEEMTLMLRISAAGNAARKVLQDVKSDIKGLQGIAGGIGGFGRGAFDVLGKTASFALGPLRFMAPIALGAGAGVAALGVKSLLSASRIQELRTQIESMVGSAAEADRILKMADRGKDFMPFGEEEIATAAAKLRMLGIQGPRALEAVADAAVTLKKPLLDVVSDVAGMNPRALRQLGIFADADGEKMIFRYRDRMNQVRQITATGAEEARKALVGIFAGNFGGASLKASGQFSGLLGSLKERMGDIFENLGGPMLAPAERFLRGVRDSLRNLVDSGKIEEAGKRFAAWLEAGSDRILAAIDTLPAIGETVRKIFEGGPAIWREVMGGVFMAGAKVFMSAVIESWRASADIFAGVGQILAASFADALAATTAGQLLGFHGGMSEQANRVFGMGLTRAGNAIPGAIGRFGATWNEEMSGIGQRVQGLVGTNPIDEYRRNLAARQNPSYAVTYRGVDYEPGSRFGIPYTSSYRTDTPPAKGARNAAGEVVINVQRLEIRADRPREIAEKLTRRAGMPALAAASG